MVSSNMAIASSGVRAVRTTRGTRAVAGAGDEAGTTCGAMCAGEALQHHHLRPDPRLELLGLVLRLELEEVLVKLGKPGIVAVVPLAAGGRLGAAPSPGEVSL
jgi:hypothetical protein